MAATVVVVGAGLAGLVAARRLAERAVDARVLEQAGRAGGRLATTRVGRAAADHGAQFFTVRAPRFAALVDGWRAAGAPVQVWCRGFAQADSVHDAPAAADTREDGHPRYVVRGGMSRLAERLAGGLQVSTGAAARAVTRSGGGWRVELEPGGHVDAAAVICTPPVPQTLALLHAGGVELPERLAAALRALAYEPCLAVLAALDGPPALPPPGGVQFRRGPVAFLADNRAKGVSTEPALTVHAAGDWSSAHAADSDAEVAGALLDCAAAWLGGAAALQVAVRRWRFSRPVQPYPQRTAGVGGLVLAGDAYGGPRVEGAALSGLHAADRALQALER